MKEQIAKKVVVTALGGLTSIAAGFAVKTMIKKLDPDLLKLNLDTDNDEEDIVDSLFTQENLIKILRYTSITVGIMVVTSVVAMIVENHASEHFMPDVKI